ncbi:MAG: hypothetical protein ABEJ69_01335 [Candidatus Nanohaloarchaea archaeon]
MSDSGSMFRVVLTAAILLMAIPAAMGDTVEVSSWNVTFMDRPHSYSNVTNGSNTVQLVKIKTDPTKTLITPENLVEGSYINFTYYNKTMYPIIKDQPMKYLQDGVWYYEFSFSGGGTGETLSPGMALVEAKGETEGTTTADATLEANASRNYTYDALNVEILEGVQQKYKANKKVVFEANVSDAATDAAITNADVFITFIKGDWVSQPQRIKNYDNNQMFYYNNRVEIPDFTNTTFVAHINASTSSNDIGVQSFKFTTYPSIEGRIEYLNDSSTANLCDLTNFPTTCEPGAKLDIGFNVTQSTATQVNLSLMLRNSTGAYKINTSTMNDQGGFYTAQVRVPEVNFSQYQDELALKFNASNADRQYIEFYNITVASYTIKDETALTAYQGSNFPIEIFFGRPVTLDTYPPEKMKNATVTVWDSNDQMLSTFNLTNMSFDPETGIWSNEINIPTDAPNGSYRLHVLSYNDQNVKKTLDVSGAFRVKDITKTFDVPRRVEFYLNRTGNLTRNITVQNLVTGGKTIMPETVGAISSFTTVNNATNITLAGSATENVTLTFEMTSLGDYTGNITFYDTASIFNQTTQVTINGPSCDQRNGTICIQKSGSLNVTTDTRATYQNSMELYFLGDLGETVNVTASVKGPLTGAVTVSPSKFNISDSETLTLNYSAEAPLNDTGYVLINSSENLRVPINFVANVSELSTEMTVTPSSKDYGVNVRDSSYSFPVLLENTGGLKLSGLSVSGDYTVSLNTTENISSGEKLAVEVQIDSLASSTGSITINAQSRDSTVSKTIDLTGELIPPYTDIETQIEDRISQLEQENTDPIVGQNLSEVNNMLPEIETQMQSGNYAEAQNLYQTAQSRLDTLETQIDQQTSNQGNQSGTTPPGGEQPGGGTTPGDEQQSGGGLLVPLLVVLFIVLLVGFVAYTSIIPEEGDPLYNVLGGE